MKGLRAPNFLMVTVFFAGLCLFLSGCASTKTETVSEPSEEPIPPVAEEPDVLESEPIEESHGQDTEHGEPVIEEQPVTEETETFVVSEEVFAQTFGDVEVLIQRLNAIIDEENYDEWLNHLTEDYKDYYGGTEVLKEISERPILKKYNIRLTNLKDYFKYVVVPSRANARLDDLVFEDNNHVKAIMIIDDQRVILYQLEKDTEQWKIGI